MGVVPLYSQPFVVALKTIKYIILRASQCFFHATSLEQVVCCVIYTSSPLTKQSICFNTMDSTLTTAASLSRSSCVFRSSARRIALASQHFGHAQWPGGVFFNPAQAWCQERGHSEHSTSRPGRLQAAHFFICFFRCYNIHGRNPVCIMH